MKVLNEKDFNCIVVLGPTASGKTTVACELAYHLNGEIISADSRQVYKSLDIGTGKDLNSYTVKGQLIKYHLIDIVDADQTFFLHDFIRELRTAFETIRSNKKIPIVCGGSGLYLDALRKDFTFTQIKEDPNLREQLENLSQEELIKKLNCFSSENIAHIDLNSRKRIIRGIEVASFLSQANKNLSKSVLPYRPFYLGIDVSIEDRKRLISERLNSRLKNGLIEEVESLLHHGITHERLQFFGLEYKFVSLFLQRQISREELFKLLETAIFQFAKRQMTWFRKMQKEGVEIYWIQKNTDLEQLATQIKYSYK